MEGLEKKLNNFEKLHRLDMIERSLSTISSYANNVISEINDDFEYEEDLNDTEIAKIISRIKSDLELLVKNYL